MSLSSNIPWENITAWLAGTLPPAEVQRLQEWIAADPTRGELIRTVRLVWDGAAGPLPTWDTRTALEAIKAREAALSRVVPLRAISTPSRAPMGWLRIAVRAAAVVGLLAGGWWIKTSAPDARVSDVAASSIQRFETTRGQRLALKLPDGSGVLLGPESVIQYASLSYGKSHRVVELQGEGYFEVTHDDTRPFEVRTTHAVIRDLGTRFVVRAHQASPAVEVAVAEGRVVLGRPRAPRAETAPFVDSVVLDRADWARMPTVITGVIASQRGVDLDRYFGWTEGRLVFDMTELADVVAELNRWYDVDITLVGSTVGRLRLTATFRDQPITEVLSSIQASLGLELSGVHPHFTLATR